MAEGEFLVCGGGGGEEGGEREEAGEDACGDEGFYYAEVVSRFRACEVGMLAMGTCTYTM